MVTVANRRPVMTLYSLPACARSHRTRIVMAEKDIAVEIIDIDPDNRPEDLLTINPYDVMPTLVDRELTLYDSRIIIEYIDERFPHPPLLPVDPVSRARCRLALYRIEHDWYSLIDDIEGADAKKADQARRHLRESVASIAPIVQQMPFFLHDELTVVDCSIAPILWRLQRYEIELPTQAKAVFQYAERLFGRRGFRGSLSAIERQMRA